MRTDGSLGHLEKGCGVTLAKLSKRRRVKVDLIPLVIQALGGDESCVRNVRRQIPMHLIYDTLFRCPWHVGKLAHLTRDEGSLGRFHFQAQASDQIMQLRLISLSQFWERVALTLMPQDSLQSSRS